MYVLNLDTQRMIIILGVILMLCAGSFMLGTQLQNPQASAALGESLELETILEKRSAQPRKVAKKTRALSEDEAISREISKFKEKDLLTTLPSESAKAPDANREIKAIRPFTPTKDRFISGPPKKAISKAPAKRRTARRPNPKNLRYTIQIAAFAKKHDARKLLGQLRAHGIPARIDRGSRFFYVRSGNSAKKTSLRSRLSAIRSKSGLQAILVRKHLS